MISMLQLYRREKGRTEKFFRTFLSFVLQATDTIIIDTKHSETYSSLGETAADKPRPSSALLLEFVAVVAGCWVKLILIQFSGQNRDVVVKVCIPSFSGEIGPKEELAIAIVGPQ